ERARARGEDELAGGAEGDVEAGGVCGGEAAVGRMERVAGGRLVDLAAAERDDAGALGLTAAGESAAAGVRADREVDAARIRRDRVAACVLNGDLGLRREGGAAARSGGLLRERELG